MDKCVKRLGMGITSGKAAKAVENQRARKLYEEIFDEDSPAFVDYYFRVKAAEDQLYRGSGNESRLSSSGHDAFTFTGFPSGNVPERRDVYLADAGRRSHLSSVWLSIYL